MKSRPGSPRNCLWGLLGRFVIHWTVCEKLEEDEDSPQGAAIDVQVRGGEEERRRGERQERRTRTHVEEER